LVIDLHELLGNPAT